MTRTDYDLDSEERGESGPPERWPCREYGHFDCATFEGGRCNAERDARAIADEAHEGHEYLEAGCPACEAQLDEGMRRYALPAASTSYPEAAEGLRTRP